MSAGVWGLPPIQLSAKRALLRGEAEVRGAAWADLGGGGGSRDRGVAYRGDGRAGVGGAKGSGPGGAAAEMAESADREGLGWGPERSGGAGPGGGREGRTGGLSRRAGGAGGEAGAERQGRWVGHRSRKTCWNLGGHRDGWGSRISWGSGGGTGTAGGRPGGGGEQRGLVGSLAPAARTVGMAAAGMVAKPTSGRLPAGPKRSGVADSPARRGRPKEEK